jgi:aminopeptidase C
MNERPIPESALRDKDSVEMLRVWIAEEGLHCSLKVGMYHESTNTPEEKAWGVILADAVRHIAKALETSYSGNYDESIKKIKESLLQELVSPTSDIKGDFIER